MKKLLLSVIAIVILGAISCKKDDSIQPQKSSKNVVADKRDLGTGD